MPQCSVASRLATHGARREGVVSTCAARPPTAEWPCLSRNIARRSRRPWRGSPPKSSRAGSLSRAGRKRRPRQQRSPASCGTEGADHVVRRDAGEEDRVDPVEHPAVAGKQAPGGLDAHVAFQRGLEEVAERGGEREREGE